MRLLIFTLSVGFFIWLPSAVADSGGGLSLDSPAHLRQVQNSDNALLTLTVKNIQVHADWHVTSDGDVFTIDNDGVLRRSVLVTGTHVAKIYAVDRFDRLNSNYANLTASAVITVDFVLGTAFYFADAPSQLFALARLPEAVTLYQFRANGGGTHTYNLVGGNEDQYFALDAASGVLSLPQNDQMRAGTYNLRVELSDGVNQATEVVRVRIVPNQVFVMGGYDTATINDLWSSMDGKTWELKTADGGWNADWYKRAVSHNGRLYIMGGNAKTDEVWSSADGKNWSLEGNAGWTGRTGHAMARHNGRMYVLGGNDGDYKNDVWSSVDGKSWSMEGNADWLGRRYHKAVFHNKRLYVMGGEVSSSEQKRDVWSSADGKNWSFEGNASWSARANLQLLSHNGRVYVISGKDSDGATNDVWSSLDGKSWVQEDGAKPIKRHSFGAYARNGLLHLFGGITENWVQDDMWSSADGKNWSFDGYANWSKRGAFPAVVHPPPLFLSGTSEVIILSLGTAETGIATVTAQNGFGNYTYLLESGSGSGFSIDSDGVLSYDGTGTVSEEEYLVTVRVEDEDGSQAKTIIRVKIE